MLLSPKCRHPPNSPRKHRRGRSAKRLWSTLESPSSSCIRKAGSFTPQQRAQAIQARLEQAASNPFSNFTAITTVETEHGTDIALEGLVLLTVTEGDASLGRNRQDLAKEYTGKLRSVLQRAQRELSAEMLLTDAALAVAATAVFVAILLVLHKIFPRIYSRIEQWQDTYIKAIKIQRVEVFSAQTLTRQVVAIARGLRFPPTIVILYLPHHRARTVPLDAAVCHHPRAGCSVDALDHR